MTKTVLISGTSTGIGKALSLELDRQGFQVFAGVRNATDADALHSQASPQLTPVMLDVTLPEMISAACRDVKEKAGGGLFCLINNAGISLGGPLEFIPIQDFRHQMEVNLVGQLALTQSCMAMIRKSAGRIIFISSVSGRLASPIIGPYAASKAALVAMADTLRMELAPWHVPVSVLIVGSVQTPIWEKSAHRADEIMRRMPEQAWQMYGETQKRAAASYLHTGRIGMRVEKVAEITRHLLEKNRPKEYILVGKDAVLYELMTKLLPIRLRDWLVRWSLGI